MGSLIWQKISEIYVMPLIFFCIVTPLLSLKGKLFILFFIQSLSSSPSLAIFNSTEMTRKYQGRNVLGTRMCAVGVVT